MEIEPTPSVYQHNALPLGQTGSQSYVMYPANMPDPIRKRFGYGQLWPLRPACSRNRAGSYMPDPTSRVRFSSVFTKEDMDHIVQNRPRSDLDGLVKVWPNTSGLEASRCAGIIWPGFWQDANGPLPVSHFQTRFHRRPGQYRAKPARIRFSSG